MKTRARKLASYAAVMLIAIVAFYLGTASLATRAQSTAISWPSQATPYIPSEAQVMTDAERLYSSIYRTASPSVVSINVFSQATNSAGQRGFTEGTGTGFVIDTAGHIVTNHHVVQGAQTIEVNFFDGRILRGEIVGTDPDSDLAVIRVNAPAESLQPIKIGDSDELFIGQSVVAIGSPFNQPWTMTTGIISALDRTIQGLNDYSIAQVIQTDAAINPGNSGGPLLNLRGEVIGVNSQIISRSRSNSGVGFAIPSNLVNRVAQDLINQGRVAYSYLGISGGEVNLTLIEALNLPSNARGVVVSSVQSGGPAARAGLQNARQTIVNGQRMFLPTDIITAIDGTPLTGMPSLVSYLANNTSPGQTVTLTVVRNGTEELTLPVTLMPRP